MNQESRKTSIEEDLVQAVNNAFGPMTEEEIVKVCSALFSLGLGILWELRGDEYVTKLLHRFLEEIPKYSPPANATVQ